jgi:hypothetical protein
MKVMRYLPLALWATACAAVLIFTLEMWEPGANSDVGVVFAWSMVLLSFPAGLVVPGCIALFATFFGQPALDAALSGTAAFVAVWAAFVLVGYVQWFLLVPRVWQSMRKARANAV